MKFNFAPIYKYMITSEFGWRNTGIEGASTYHKGIDLVSSMWRDPCNLILVHDGKLIKSYWNNIRGWTCEFDIGQGYSVLYQHMKYSCSCKVGEDYPAGTIVGFMGKTSTLRIDPHLHFEVKLNGVAINPLPFISRLEEQRINELIDAKLKGEGNLPSKPFAKQWAYSIFKGWVNGLNPQRYTTKEEVNSMIQRGKK